MSTAMAEIVEAANHVQLGSVRLGASGAAEMDGDRPLLSVPREEILGLNTQFTIGGERPFITLVLGVVLIAIAVIPVLTLLDVLRRGGTYYIEWAAAVACIIPAIWLINLSVRRRWVLVVTTRRGRRKLLFPKNTSQVEVEVFVAKARSRFAYSESAGS